VPVHRNVLAPLTCVDLLTASQARPRPQTGNPTSGPVTSHTSVPPPGSASQARPRIRAVA